MVNASGESFTGVTVIEKPVSTLSCPSEALTVSEASPNQLRCGDMVIVSDSMTKSKYGSPEVISYSKSSPSISSAFIIIEPVLSSIIVISLIALIVGGSLTAITVTTNDVLSENSVSDTNIVIGTSPLKS